MSQLPDNLNAAIKALRRRLGATALEGDVAKDLKQPLYHYTNAAGLNGILRNGEIWQTSVFHLNDPTELSHTFEVAQKQLRSAADAGPGLQRDLCEAVWSQVENAGGLFGFYVTSFSRKRNHLGQWRAYADDGRGFAIGLAPDLFHRDKKNSALGEAFLSHVTYDFDATKQRIADTIKSACDCVATAALAANNKMEFLRQVAIQIMPRLVWFAMTTKHEIYEDEAEIRMFAVKPLASIASTIQTRVRGSDLIPYIRHPLPLSVPGNITEIVLGPAAGPEARDAVYSLLLSRGLGNTPINDAAVPYRSQRL